jgi:hypothetical protein
MKEQANRRIRTRRHGWCYRANRRFRTRRLDGAKGEDGGVVEDRLAAVETKVKCLSDSDADDFILRGCNVHVQNGADDAARSVIQR